MHTLQSITRGICELSAAAATKMNLVGRGIGYQRMLDVAAGIADVQPGFASSLTDTALRTLVQSLDEEAGLSSLGALFARHKLATTIANRLRLEAAFRRGDGRIERALREPVFIAGLPRTGTTLLHRLLAEHDELRTLRLAEVLEPFGDDHGGRERRAADVVRAIGLFAPGALEAHPMAADRPGECQHLMEATFVSAFFVHFAVPSYTRWMLSLGVDDLAEACSHYQRFVAVAATGDQRFLSKAPAHVLYGAALPQTFPGMWVIRTHRPAEAALPSLANLVALYRRMFSRTVDDEEIGRLALEVFRTGGRRMIEMHERLQPGRAIDIDYARFVADPVGTAMAVFDRLGLGTPPAIESRLRRCHARERVYARHPARYSLHRFGLTREAVAAATAGHADWLAQQSML